MKKYFIITYGCQMNKSDSERIATVLENMGYKPASNISRADLIAVNMCSVRQSAVDRVLGIIPQLKKLKAENLKLKTILTGCILTANKKKFKEGFNLILNIKDLENWPKYLKLKNVKPLPWQLFDVNSKNNKSGDGDDVCYLKIRPKYKNNFSAFLPTSNGCNNFCSYCVVPFTRGPLVSRPWKEILAETKNLIERGFKEIWLLGQNVNSYQDSGVNFSKLLEMINDIPGNFWLRFTSSHPKDFSDDLIEAMARCEKVTEYLNLPVQSGDDEILKKMNRPYNVKQYKNLVKRIREKIPEISLSTDVIVGFCGETKKQFQSTVKLLEEIGFDMAYISRYSPRPGTAAAKMRDNVPRQEKEKRWKLLTKILKRTALKKNKNFIGKVVEVLPEEIKSGFLMGKSRAYKTVKFKGKKDLIGKFVRVKIADALPWGLKGEKI